MAAKRDFSEPVALNWTADGTDVDFGSLSKQLIGFGVRNGTTALFGHEVRNLSRQSDGSWTVKVRNRRTGEKRKLNAKFVFVGAGGDALPLLQKSGIKEAKGFGGFPIGGQFLRTDNPALTAAHRAKVYGVPAPGAPPLGALHLDLRFVNGKSWLVFGPYAGWSPKFLKQGHVTDLPRSVKPDNLLSMLGVGLTEMTLVNYLIGQLRLSEPDRVRVLREFAPSAVDSDWELTVAGQRVQVIRRDKRKGGVLEFGTTVVGSADGSIAGLLGGSPGASTAVPIMLDVLERCFRRPISVLAAHAQRDGAVAGRRAVRRAGAVRRGVVVGHQGVAAGGLVSRAGDDAVRSDEEERRNDEALRRIWAKDLDARDPLRAAQAAGRGVRRRTGHPVSGTGRPRPARRDPALLAGKA